MQDNDNINKFLAIEDTEEILTFTVPELDMPLWLYIRFPFFSNFPQKWSVVETTYPPYPTKRTFLRHLPELLSPWPKRDIWFISDLQKNYYKNIDNKYFDIYFEPLANIFPGDSLYISRSIYASRLLKKPELEYKFIQSASILCQKISSCCISQLCYLEANNLMEFVQNRIYSLFGMHLHQDLRKYFMDRLLRQVSYEYMQYKFYKLLFRYRKPKILFITDPILGKLALIKLAKEYGITTVEFQHGTSGLVSVGYNWANTLRQSKRVRSHVVDYFLTYGDFWNNRFQLPCELYPVGNPWFSTQCKRHVTEGRAILFCLSTSFAIYPDLIRDLAAAFPDRRIIVRPHPNHRQAFLSSDVAGVEGISVDEETDVYTTFSQAEIVIGDISTSLMEALALGKRVYSLRSSQAEKYFSNLDVSFFSDAPELINLINDATSGRIPQTQRDALFCTDWEKNYTTFITQLLAN